MSGTARPVMVMRARPLAGQAEVFFRWVREVHVRDTRAVPGVVAVRAALTPCGEVLAVYVLRDGEAVGQALQSAEAAYARGTLEQWADRLAELRFEIYAPVPPLRVFASIN